jgi:hypothetical protein
MLHEKKNMRQENPTQNANLVLILPIRTKITLKRRENSWGPENEKGSTVMGVSQQR